MRYNRPAIAMIELIFAIVVMGIVMMSAPMLISSAQKTTGVALQQEGINEAVTRVSQVLTYEWDENISANLESTGCVPVLHVASGDTELNMAANSRRIGVGINSSSRTFNKCVNDFNASATLGIEGSAKDDIDDFAYISLAPVLIGTGGVNYIEQGTVDIATSVYYSSDAANYNSTSINFNFDPANLSGSSTNIKTISVTLTSSSGMDELNKSIVLNAFSCNTGDGFDFQHRSFP